MRIGIVGCGDIAVPYARSISTAPGLELVAAFDALADRAERLSGDFGGHTHESLTSLLADQRVETVLNLTPATAHAEVTTAALEAGKHVYSEKPLALGHDQAHALIHLAEAKGLVLGSAPATLLGEAQQTMWKLVREGAIGHVRVAYAEANWGRVESWHPTPLTLHNAGAARDVGVYPLAILTAIFGPVRSVRAFAATVEPDRVDMRGVPFRIHQPDVVVALLELDSGVVVRLTASFYVSSGKHRGIELYGDRGMLHLESWAEFDSRLQLSTSERGGNYKDVSLVRAPYAGIDWSRSLLDFADAIHEDRSPRASATHAAHLVEILDAIEASDRDGGRVDVHSSFPPPLPIQWATAEQEGSSR
jgi:predicted dehydrogenase